MTEPATTPETTPATPQAAQTPATPAGPYEGFFSPTGEFVKENWADSLPPEAKEAGATLKNFKNFSEVANELHRLTRAQDGSIKIPGPDATDAEKAAWRKAYGALDKPEEYGLPDDARAIAELAAKHGLTKSQATEIANWRKSESESAKAKEADETSAFVKSQQDDLLKTWAKDTARNVEQAKKLAQHFGVNLEEYPDAPLAKMVFEFSKWCQEDPNMMTGKGIPSGLFSMVAPNARSQAEDIMTNPNNPKFAAYRSGDKSVIQEVTTLLQRG